MTMRTIVLPLDGTAHALAALPVAAALARIEGTTLHVLHVGEVTIPARELLRQVGLDAEALRGSVLEQAIGRPAAAVLEWASEHESPVIVMCTHTGMEKPRGTLGSVAEEVVRSAMHPVVLVQPERGTRPWEIHRIMLPHDGTPATASAMDPAGDLAHRTGAEVLVLHVAAPTADQPQEPGTIAVPRYLDQPQHEWSAWGAEFLDRMTVLGHPPEEVKFRLSMAAGEPGREIVRFAREHGVDLIVLAWHGRWDGHRASTLKMVIRDSGCPTLVLRADRDPESP